MRLIEPSSTAINHESAGVAHGHIGSRQPTSAQERAAKIGQILDAGPTTSGVALLPI
jgi:hypothetical protein